jgi:hypothetical protein
MLKTYEDGSQAIVPAEGFTICVVRAREGFEQDIPNAKLMAAAPEMLEALELLLNHVLHYASMPKSHSEAGRDAAKAMAAIRKATA